MDFYPTILNLFPFFNNPSIIELIFSGLLFVLTLLIIQKSNNKKIDFSSKKRSHLIFIVASTSILSAILGINFPPESDNILLIFSLAFVVISSNFFGIIATIFITLIAGLIFGLFESHTITTSFIYMFIGAIYWWFVNQRYRLKFFSILRNPFSAWLATTIIFSMLNIGLNFLNASNGSPVSLSQLISTTSFSAIGFLAQGIISIIIFNITYKFFDDRHNINEALIPFPTEKNIQLKLLVNSSIITLIFVIIIGYGGFQILKTNKITQYQSEVEKTSKTISVNFPLSILLGQNLLDAISEKYDLINTPESQLGIIFAEEFRWSGYFQQMYLINLSGDIQGGFPLRNQNGDELKDLKSLGINNDINLDTSTTQTFFLISTEENKSSKIVLIKPITNNQGNFEKILIGLTNVDGNLFLLPSLNLIQHLNEKIGSSYLTDSTGNVLYPSDSVKIPININSLNTWEASNYNEINNLSLLTSVGIDNFIFSTIENEKVISTSIPVIIQFLILTLMLIIAGYIIIKNSLNSILQFTSQIERDANRISRGSVTNKLFYNRDDELGKLGKAIESMRVQLNANQNEAKNILKVSQGIASSTALQMTIPPILEGALAQGGDIARLVLYKESIQKDKYDGQTNFGIPQPPIDYSEFDDIVLSLTETKQNLVLNNPSKSPLKSNSKKPPPGAVISIGLKDDEKYLGALWVAYINPHQITKIQEKYLQTIAKQASVAIKNAIKKISGQREEKTINAIFESTKLPVLVTDQKLNILLINSSAKSLFNNKLLQDEKLQKGKIPTQLWEILTSKEPEILSKEMKIGGNSTYLVNFSPLSSLSESEGVISIFCDISNIKTVSNQKSEMITTVSHGIRNPILSIQGGATMIGKIGDLTETQKKYLDKIIEETKNANIFVEELLNPDRFLQTNGLNIESFSLTEVVNKLFEFFDRPAKSKKISYSASIPKEEIFIEGDELLLKQAISNLIDNSISYSQNKGRVEISLSHNEGNALIVITDKGKGISPIDKQALFDSENNNEPKGLLISKSICEQHNGKLEMKSELGKGSSFQITIPLKQ